MRDIYKSQELQRRNQKNKASFKESETYKRELKNLTYISEDPKKRKETSAHSEGPLSAFCFYPKNVNFVTADPEEKIILLLRKHPITNVKWMSFAFLMIIAPSFVNMIPMWESLPWQFKLISMTIWYLITTAFIFEEFLSWFFHVFIVTDERIVDVDFVNLIYREMTDASISNIQDVTVQMGGVVRTMFNYGDVSIQTAAGVPKIDFEAVPYPDKVARILRELRIEEEIEQMEGRIR